jgi:putative membrane protein
MIAQSIADLEIVSQAEVVLVVRIQSGRYQELSYLLGAIVSLFILAFLLYSPDEYQLESFFFILLFGFYVCAKFFEKLGVFRWLISRKRQKLQVIMAANHYFMNHIFNKTKKQTGLLLYISLREKSAIMLADVGIQKVLDKKKLEDFNLQFEKIAIGSNKSIRIAEFIETLRLELAKVLPVEDSENELANLPDFDTEGEGHLD